MRVTLYEPAAAVEGRAYAGWANWDDELYFPHVDSCCALIIVGDQAAVGGHMGAQLPGMAEPDPDFAGRNVWELVLANHLRLNTADTPCTVITIGDNNWHEVIQAIWIAVDPDGVLPLRMINRLCPHGVNVLATRESIVVELYGTNTRFTYAVPVGMEAYMDVCTP